MGIQLPTANGGGGAGNTGCPGGQGNYGGGEVGQVCTMPNGAVYGAAPLPGFIPVPAAVDAMWVMAAKVAASFTSWQIMLPSWGSITAKGQDGGIQGGLGGSIRLEGAKLTLGVLNAMGGKGANNAAAGVGRIAIYYVNTCQFIRCPHALYPKDYCAAHGFRHVHAYKHVDTDSHAKPGRHWHVSSADANSTSPNLDARSKCHRHGPIPDHDGPSWFEHYTVPDNGHNATGTAQSLTATARANLTGTAQSLTSTAQANLTPDLNATGTALSLTMTAQVSTPDYDATGTAQSLTATAQAGTPNFNATGTALSLTMTAQAASPTPSLTPDHDATGTAQALTATAQNGPSETPDFNATGTALAKTATAWASSPTPSITPTLTPTATLSPTTSPSPTSTSNGNGATPTSNGGGGGGGNGGQATPTLTPGGSPLGVFGAACAITLQVYVYVDTNIDSMMAAQGEGVNSLQVNFLDTSFGKVGQSYTSNGKATFCVPDYLKGQTLRVDIPYLQRTGIMQAPEDNNKNQPIEMWFRLEPPTLPLFIP